MDKSVTPKKGKNLFKGDWETKFKKLIKNFRQHELLDRAEIKLPLGYCKMRNVFGKIDIKEVNKKRRKGGNINFMRLFIEKTRFESINSGIEITFEMKVNHSYKMLKPSFEYNWNHHTNKVTITKYLGTTKPKEIEKIAEDVLSESRLFKKLYSDHDVEFEYAPLPF